MTCEASQDDGNLDPAGTRQVLGVGLALSAWLKAPFPGLLWYNHAVVSHPVVDL